MDRIGTYEGADSLCVREVAARIGSEPLRARIKPEAPRRVDVSARGVACCVAGWIGEDHNWKLQSLGLVDSHEANAFGAFLDNGRFISVAALRTPFEFIDEGSERRGAALEPTMSISRCTLASACSPVGHSAIPACARTASSSIVIVWAIGPRLRPI